jgi:hypothetical protein
MTLDIVNILRLTDPHVFDGRKLKRAKIWGLDMFDIHIHRKNDKCVCEISNSGGESEDRGADDGEL